ncbi:MAG: copper-binding protein [Deltaproteobacteria bacterium HGW-Deltaproteobacteria-12]|jgi:Cu/Ag efflux protein CusF|nr:MAG: copper-binding protein [Deltaproteobacteria bacterium HGW-Deltaproteobacteria-12]
MKTMKSLSTALVIFLMAGFSGNALSEEKPVDAVMQQAPASIEMTDGVIRKVDKTNSKITIKHGEIKNLDMPGMTMVFQVKHPDLLDKVQAGDKVKFRAEKSGSAFVVTDIQLDK